MLLMKQGKEKRRIKKPDLRPEKRRNSVYEETKK